MNTNKLIGKLDKFFNLSIKKQEKKHEKLLKIIERLEFKKSQLEIEVINESKSDETSNRYHELSQELKVISKLIKKAKKTDTLEN
jgi:hypothetical protein